MATQTDKGWPNIVDVTSRLDPDGRLADIAEVLNEELDWLRHVPFVEGNLATGHKITDRTALPSMANAYRQFNRGVPAVKSRVGSFEEVCGMLEVESAVDADLAELSGNVDAYRASEAKPIIEAMSQEFARALFYESVLNSPEKIHGLSARYPATTGYRASDYVLTGTNAGVNCHSIWLITFDPERIFSIYPKGSKAGLTQEDLGRQRVLDADGNSFMALIERFQWKYGLAVRDYRYAVRMQWDPDDSEMAADKKGLYLLLQRGLNQIKKISPHTALYMNRFSRERLGSQLLNNSLDILKGIEVGGRPVEHFATVPIHLVDALVAESAIS